LRDAYFRAIPEVCDERARLVTAYHQKHGLLGQAGISALDKAQAYRYLLEQREPVVFAHTAYAKHGEQFTVEAQSLFAGSTTSRFKGVLLYPEMMALALWPELHSLSTRSKNPYYIDAATRETLNRQVFPAWMDFSLLELARKRRPGAGEATPDFDLLARPVFFLASKPNCVSHTIPDFSRAVRQGLRALIDEAQVHAESTRSSDQREHYQAMTEVLEGVVSYSRRLAERAAVLASQSDDPAQQGELLALVDLHRRVPEFPASSFREGLTTVWVCWTALHQENANVGLSLGRLDQLLYPFYRADMDAGRLTLTDAVELLCCLWLKIGDHVPSVPESAEQLFGGTGSNQAITIGGVDRDGNDAVNDLTYVMLRATELMLLRDPNLNARYMPGVNQPEYLERLCRCNVRTRATPALHNDAAVIAALQQHGDSLEDARDYGVVGCVEPCSAGRHYGHSGALLLNLPSVLELMLFNGRHRHTGLNQLITEPTGDPRGFATMADVRTAFAGQLRQIAARAVAVNNAMGAVYRDYYPSPLLSALFEGPMQKARDVTRGGANGNSSGVAIVGFADVVDSLSAIERLVFGTGKLGFGELLAALEADFVGYEVLLARLENPDQNPAFGNDELLSDRNARWLVTLLHDTFTAHRNVRDGAYRVGYWTMTNHAGFGMLLGSMPNGRRSRQNFASGITPRSGKTPELLRTLHSVAGLPTTLIGNGMALNIKFVPEGTDLASQERMLHTFRAAVAGYFAPANDSQGGMEIQFNVTSSDDLRRALDNPEELATLLVRVSGYTAYFKDLTPEMQQEIIARTQYRLSTGHFVPVVEVSLADPSPSVDVTPRSTE
jgi:formate C-acetyltransferase